MMKINDNSNYTNTENLSIRKRKPSPDNKYRNKVPPTTLNYIKVTRI